MEYIFTALDAKGTKRQERLNAESEEGAIRSLHQQGYVILSLSPAAEKGRRATGKPRSNRPTAEMPGSSDASRLGSIRFGRRVKAEQIVVLTRELAVMIETGISIVEALESLKDHAENRMIRESLEAALHDLSEGKTISQAMSSHPKIFPPFYVDMVRTAEVGGNLDETLNQAADYLEASLEMRRKVKGALTYPMVLLTVAVGVVIFMMTYLLPQFSKLFAKMGAPLPLSTRLMFAVSDFVTIHWWALPAGILGPLLGMRLLLRLPAGQMFVMRTMLRVPFVGDTVRKVALARMLRALGTLQGSGVGLLLSLETAALTAQNVVFQQAMLQVRQSVEEGHSLTEAVREARVFPPMVCQMIAAGEKSGRLNTVLLRIAVFYERDVDARLKALTSIIEPVMIVVIGLIVGLIAITIITPIYSLVDTVK